MHTLFSASKYAIKTNEESLIFSQYKYQENLEIKKYFFSNVDENSKIEINLSLSESQYHIKSWFELLEYLIGKKMLIKSEDQSRIGFGKNFFCKKLIQAGLAKMQTLTLKTDLEVYFYKFLQESPAQTNNITSVEEDILNNLECLISPLKQIDKLVNLENQSKGLLLFNITLIFLQLSKIKTENNDMPIFTIECLTSPHYQDLLNQVHPLRDLEDLVFKIKKFNSQRIFKTVDLLRKIKEFSMECTQFDLETFCLILILKFEAYKLALDECLKGAFTNSLPICYSLIVKSDRELRHLEYIHQAFLQYLLKSNDYILRNLVKNPIYSNSLIEDTAILLNVNPKNIRGYFRANLLELQVKEFKCITSIISQSFISRSEYNYIEVTDETPLKEFISISNLSKWLSCFQNITPIKCRVLEKLIEFRINALNVGLVNKAGKKPIFKLNPTRVNSYCNSYPLVLAHFQDSVQLKTHLIGIVEVNIINEDRKIEDLVNKRGRNGKPLRTRLSGYILKAIRQLWLLKIMAKIMKYRVKIKQNIKGSHQKFIIYSLKLKHYDDFFRIPKLNALCIEAFLNLKHVEVKTAEPLLANIALYFDDILDPPRNCRNIISQILENLKDVKISKKQNIGKSATS